MGGRSKRSNTNCHSWDAPADVTILTCARNSMHSVKLLHNKSSIPNQTSNHQSFFHSDLQIDPNHYILPFLPTHCLLLSSRISTQQPSIISMKLVKKLLQDHGAKEREEKAAAAAVAANATATTTNNTGLRKRKRNAKDDAPQEANDEDAFQATVRNMLFLDRKMAKLGGSEKKKRIMKRITKASQQQKKERTQAATSVLGNSRGSSSQLRLKPEPTFNKQKHKKQKECQRLQKIAKLLNNPNKKKRQAKGSKP